MRRLAVIVVAALVFLLIAFGLARWLTVENAERNDVTELLTDQARGDVKAMLAKMPDCARQPACVADVEADARDLRAKGEVEIVLYESGTSYALGEATGPTRVVWKTPDRLTTVQCVGVHRTGNVLTGVSVSLTSLSEPIDRQGDC